MRSQDFRELYNISNAPSIREWHEKGFMKMKENDDGKEVYLCGFDDNGNIVMGYEIDNNHSHLVREDHYIDPGKIFSYRLIKKK